VRKNVIKGSFVQRCSRQNWYMKFCVPKTKKKNVMFQMINVREKIVMAVNDLFCFD